MVTRTLPEIEDYFPAAIRRTGYFLGSVFFLLTFSFKGVSPGTLLSKDIVVGLVVNGPFFVAIVYGGYWLDRDRISRERYRRVGGWFVGGLVGFLSLNVLMIVVWSTGSLYNDLAWAYFAANVGGAIGLGIGIFEARAIEREVVAERHRLKNQEMARRNERLDEFASIVSHDLRSPLNVVRGNIELARAEHDSEYLDSAETALDRMASLIEDLLELARSGARIESVEPVDLESVVERCWRHVETVDATLTVDVDRRILADRSRLQQLLENLVRNAIEHGGADVTVTVGALGDGFYVADDGPGIPDEEREAVFDPGHSTATGGTGLGLAIVRQIADAHEWDVRATDAAEGGARFEITGVEFEDAGM